MAVYNHKGSRIRTGYSPGGSILPNAYKADGTPLWFEDFRPTAVMSALPAYSVNGIKQGACTDGEYIYQIRFDSNAYTTGTFIKYKIADGTVTTKTFDATIPYSHGNDMAYNPNNGHIYVAAMTSDGAVMELDTDFNYIATHYLVDENGDPYSVWGLCYDQKTDRFLSEHGSYMYAYDQSLNYISHFTMPAYQSATGQGCETDGEFIYRVWYNPNMIDVSTIDGTYVGIISIPLSSEPETLMYNWTNGQYYININSSGQLFYDIDLKY